MHVLVSSSRITSSTGRSRGRFEIFQGIHILDHGWIITNNSFDLLLMLLDDLASPTISTDS